MTTQSRYVTARDLGINLSENNESEIFKWFLASFLFGKHIQQSVAEKTWEEFMKRKIDSPKKIQEYSSQELVDLLGKGGYVRYDESTARYLLDTSRKLNDEYEGKITKLHDIAYGKEDFKKLLRHLKGVGPKTVEIFLRSMNKYWY